MLGQQYLQQQSATPVGGARFFAGNQFPMQPYQLQPRYGMQVPHSGFHPPVRGRRSATPPLQGPGGHPGYRHMQIEQLGDAQWQHEQAEKFGPH